MLPLLTLFYGSGCASLIYEIVWFQALQPFIGSSAVCLEILLATFMGGLCLGSLAGPRFISRNLAGSGINSDDRTTIYLDLVRHRRYPDELFQCPSF